MIIKQQTWTPEQVEEALRAGALLKNDDRVWVDSTNMSIFSYLRRYHPELRRKRSPAISGT
jgi:hypothetical protein